MTTEISSKTDVCHQEADSCQGQSIDSASGDASDRNSGDNQRQSSNVTAKPRHEGETERADGTKSPDSNQLEESKNDSSNLSTAFTISFDDPNGTTNSSGKKLFGIRDSIRKFAPPKPNTIEKPRPSKAEASQENSYMSLESAPSYSKKSPTFRRGQNNASCRSSDRRSDSSRRSNISESAAFLIDRMLNTNKQSESLSSIYLNSDSNPQKVQRSQTITKSSAMQMRNNSNSHQSAEEPTEDGVDFSEDRSDNGTYIVGADPESDAARKRIEELFGVVKAAEASLVASAAAKATKQKSKPPLATRPSRAPEKKAIQQMSRERKEHIDRLAMGRNTSRSSSSSRHEVSSVGDRRPQSSGRKPLRNSSCDRGYSKLPTAQRNHRRATSQSSRQSSNCDPSEPNDTRSSRSSLHTQDVSDILLAQQENQNQNLSNPGMKFNRAFALRRARLGLGEPTRPGAPQNNGSSTEQDGPVSLLVSPKRSGGGNAVSGMYPRYNQPPSSQNLSRTDGGRFSLRMRNHVGSRLTSGFKSNHIHGATFTDNHSTKNSNSSKLLTTATTSSAITASKAPSSIVPYPSGDELDAALLSPSRVRQGLGRYTGNSSSATSTKMQNILQGRDIAPEWEMIDSDNRLNYGLCLDQSDMGPTSTYAEQYSRPSHSATTRRGSNSAIGGGGQQQSPLGALDCLVISAISGLSMKIRGSVCNLMVEHAKRLPSDNETRLIVEEILPQLSADSARPKSPTSIEEIDQSVYFELAQTLKNLKKLEQMVEVIRMISNQMPSNSLPLSGNLEDTSNSNATSKSSSTSISTGGVQGLGGNNHSGCHQAAANVDGVVGGGSNTNSEATNLSPSSYDNVVMHQLDK